MDLAECKERLLLQIQSAAHWRAEKAEEYPEDERNAQSATSLYALAERINALPSDHSDIRRLWNIEKESDDDQSLLLTKLLSEILSRYGFDDTSEMGDPEQFLSSFVSELGDPQDYSG